MKDTIKYKREKYLTLILPKKSGRNTTGKITSHHRGGREKRFYRKIDFKRDKHGVSGRVVIFEYDPNRNVDIVLVQYSDGEKRYILKPLGLKLGDTISSGKDAEVKVGNSLSLTVIPIGTPIHNVELYPGIGGQMVRGAGTAAFVLAKEEKFVHVKLPSGEIRKIAKDCCATIGQLSSVDYKARSLGKAGRSRHMGIRPKVRGTAKHPDSHPHGGGEGRSGVGLKHPKTPWGKTARGLATRKKKKYSDKYIIKRRKT